MTIDQENNETIDFYEEELDHIKRIFNELFGKETTENCYDGEGDLDFEKLQVAVDL